MSVYFRAGAFGLLGSGHPLAAFFPGVDVSRGDRTGTSREPVGIFHRHLSGGAVGLREYFCHHIFCKWTALAFSVDSQWSARAPGPVDRRAGVVFEPGGGDWVRVGVFAAREKGLGRCRQVSGDVCADDGIFSSRRDRFPATLSATFPRNAASTPAVAGGVILSG